MNVIEATETLVARGHVGRGERAWSQLWQVPTFFVGLLAFLSVAATSNRLISIVRSMDPAAVSAKLGTVARAVT